MFIFAALTQLIMKQKCVYILILSFLSIVATAQNRNKIPSSKPKLVVGIVVEQMRSDYISRFWDKFSDKGFKRLYNNGASCKNTYVNYAYTHSLTGYASIYSGAVPADHGIIADQWYDRLKGLQHVPFRHDKFPATGSNSKKNRFAPSELTASTIIDELKLNSPRSKCLSVSFNPQSSILMAGHLADAAYWVDPISGGWITSSFYKESLPSWVKSYNNNKYANIYINDTWKHLLSAERYTKNIKDDSKYEIGLKNRKKFPYNISALNSKTEKYKILGSIPHGNTYTKNFAIQSIVGENLGKDKYTDFLSIGFVATEQIGNNFGPLSLELEDAYLRLDYEIGFLLDFIDREVGLENCLIFLTSNHGCPFPPRYLKDIKMPGGYFRQQQAYSLLTSYLNAAFGEAKWISHYDDLMFYFDHVLIENSNLNLTDFQKRAADFLVQFSGVAKVLTASDLQAGNFNSGVNMKVQNSFNSKNSGDLMVILEPGWTETEGGKTILHNSPYSYDTHVPLVWYGWKIQRQQIFRTLEITDIVPTLSSFLGIPVPNKCSGQNIYELGK